MNLWRIYDHKYAIFRKILWQFYDLKLWQSCDEFVTILWSSYDFLKIGP